MSGTQQQQTPGTASVEDTFKDFWSSRPRRPRRGRKIAGVAAGIGNRYGIDPIVVRVAFVVATFYGGAGILLYLLGWLFLPEQDDEVAPFEAMVGKGRSSTSTGFTVLLCLAMIPLMGFFFDDNFSAFAALAVAAGAVFLLHRSRGELHRPAPAEPAATADTEGGMHMAAPTERATGPAEPAADSPAEPAAEPRTEPPAWDPLGAAPFAWDLPEPTPAPSQPRPPVDRRRSKVGVLTFGAALAVGGGLALAAPYVDGWLTPAHIVGVVLGVLGIGMVTGSFVRGGRGLIGLAVPLSLVGIVLTVVAPHGWHGVGDLTERPTSVPEVEPLYQRSVGNIELDLTGLPDSGNVETKIDLGMGNVVVTVPETADVDISCSSGLGNTECLDLHSAGPDNNLDVQNTGTDGEGGLQVELDAKVGVGNLEVRRG